jgi:thiamine-phosphate pyrophosphorylase
MPGNARPVLCLVTNSEVSALPLLEAVARAVEGGVDWVQIREQGLSDQEYLDLSHAIADAAREAGPVQVWMNRRLDIALAIEAEGIHLGSNSVSPKQLAEFRHSMARSMSESGKPLALSVATHCETTVKQAHQNQVDFVQLAPVFAPLSKPSKRAALGLERVEQAAVHGVPLLAQGGITPAHCAALLQAGCAGVAVTGAILQSSDPGQAARDFREVLDKFDGFEEDE